MPPARPENANPSQGRFSSERAFSVADSKISWAVRRRLSGAACSLCDIRHWILLNALGFSLRGCCWVKSYNCTVDSIATPAAPKIDKPWRKFTLKQRILLWLIEWAGFLTIRALGPTIRFSVSWEKGSPKSLAERPKVYSFWHNCMIPAMYWCRDLQVRVMSSDSFDGEYTGRIMQKFGFVKVRGSSSKGAVRALLGMRREIEQGWTAAFTIDGPKGPRYVAKPGPVVLSRSTGAPMVVFHIALDRAWVLKTWDGAMIPKPFCRALMRVSREIPVPKDGGDEKYLGELQAALDRVRIFAEENIGKAAEFPRGKSNRDEH
jgi:lysophospholipid acyltransferase (LPLAT)-like uncharacterized protein